MEKLEGSFCSQTLTDGKHHFSVKSSKRLFLFPLIFFFFLARMSYKIKELEKRE